MRTCCVVDEHEGLDDVRESMIPVNRGDEDLVVGKPRLHFEHAFEIVCAPRARICLAGAQIARRVSTSTISGLEGTTVNRVEAYKRSIWGEHDADLGAGGGIGVEIEEMRVAPIDERGRDMIRKRRHLPRNSTRLATIKHVHEHCARVHCTTITYNSGFARTEQFVDM